MKRICVLCWHEFESKSSRRTWCYEDHFHSCPICGCDVLTDNLHHTHTCCCKEHTILLRKQTTKFRYPNNEHMNRPESAERRRSKNPFCSESGQKYLREKFMDKYGVDNCSKLPSVIERRKSTCLERYGCESWAGSDIGKETMLHNLEQKYHVSIRSTLELPEVKDKCAKTNLLKYDSENPMQHFSVWKKQRTNSRSRFIANDGTKLDSKYEVAVYDFCCRNDIVANVNVPIKYVYNGTTHTTFIDFNIQDILFEVKGEHILDGYYDYRGVPISAKLQVYEDNSVVVITGKSKQNLFSCSSGFSKRLGADINLFRRVTNFRNSRFDVDDIFNYGSDVVDMYLDERKRFDAILYLIHNYTGFIDINKVASYLCDCCK